MAIKFAIFEGENSESNVINTVKLGLSILERETFSCHSCRLTLSADLLRKALNVTPADSWCDQHVDIFVRAFTTSANVKLQMNPIFRISVDIFVRAFTTSANSMSTEGVRFSALYLQQKRNLLVLDHSHQQVSVKLQMNPIFRISVDIFVRALTTSANVPSIYIQLFWNTLTHDAKTGVYSFQVDEHWLTLSADLLRKALNVTPADSAHPFESPPAGKTDITFTRRRVPSNWLMKMKFNRLLNLIWMIMSTIYNKTSRKLPVVEVKGKGSATERQCYRSSQDETTGPSVHPEDATSTKMVHETLSHANAESGGNSEKVGSNSEQSHVALAGPNPEHM
ncbi:hypothetical protein Tco_1161989, partial [Tanacetum coccineum]